VDVIELTADDPRLPVAYTEVLSLAFPRSEMVSLASLQNGLKAGTTTVQVMCDEAGSPSAVVVGDWSESSRLQLLSYLAVRPGCRAQGLGGQLLDAALANWRTNYRPCAIVAEVELPAEHEATEQYGDPAARMRFYARHGAKALHLPYFQPALGAGPRWYGMALLSLHLDPELAGAEPDTYSAEPLRTFMLEYLDMAEGSVSDDPAVIALFDAIGRPGGCPLLPIEDLDLLPVSTPDGPR
jgi:GNAT superfamily N-acetyltransferase